MATGAFGGVPGSTLAVTAGAAATLLPLTQPVANYRVYNAGTGTAFITFGNSTVAATAPVVGGAAGSIPIAPGSVETFTIASSGVSHVSVIAPTGGGTVYFTPGSGL